MKAMKARQHIADRRDDVPLMQPTIMAEDMLWYINRYDWVTYPELQQRYGEQSKGDLSIENPVKNVIFWTGMSRLFVDAMNLLHAQGAIHPHGAGILTYVIDGGMLTLPLVKSGRAYQKPHWLPICFRPHYSCTHKDCPKADVFAIIETIAK